MRDTNLSTIRALENHAKAWRISALRTIADTGDTTPLQQNATGPLALGFSAADLGWYRNETLRYLAEAEKDLRDDQAALDRDVKDHTIAAKRLEYNAHKWRTRIHEAHIAVNASRAAVARYTAIVNALTVEIARRYPPVTKPVVMASPSPEKVAVITMERMPEFKITKHVKKTPLPRCETTLHGFNELENTLLLMLSK